MQHPCTCKSRHILRWPTAAAQWEQFICRQATELYIYYIDLNNSRNWDSNSLTLKKSSIEVLASVFWDKYRILLVDYLERGAVITAKYYIPTGLQTSRQAFKRNFHSSRCCRSSQSGHYTPESGRSSLWTSETPWTASFKPLLLSCTDPRFLDISTKWR